MPLELEILMGTEKVTAGTDKRGELVWESISKSESSLLILIIILEAAETEI